MMGSPLSDAQYAKTEWRKDMRNLPIEQKVQLIIEMQKRVAPIYAKRGITIRPWEFPAETPAQPQILRRT